MDLIQLGWNPFFEKQFEQFKTDNMMPGRVAREDKFVYTVWTEQGEIIARVVEKQRFQAGSKADFPAVGDWVALARHDSPDQRKIVSILPRSSCFLRKVAGRTTEEQVLAANIDTVFLVTGLDNNFSVRRIERYLTLAWNSGASPVVVLNKADVCPEIEQRTEEVRSVAIGVPVHAISAVNKEGLEPFATYLAEGRTVALLGSSGVGKSTLINALLGNDLLDTGGVRLDDSRGRHTTTHREMVRLPDGGILIDTPGMRELQVWGDDGGLRRTFEDIEELAANCRFGDCSHENEPGCAVQQALDEGAIDVARFESYLKLQREFEHLERRKDQKMARHEQRERGKKFAKMVKQVKRMTRERGSTR